MKRYRIRMESKLSDKVYDEGMAQLRKAQIEYMFGDNIKVELAPCSKEGILLSKNIKVDDKGFCICSENIVSEIKNDDDKRDKDVDVDVATRIVNHYIDNEVKHQS